MSTLRAHTARHGTARRFNSYIIYLLLTRRVTRTRARARSCRHRGLNYHHRRCSRFRENKRGRGVRCVEGFVLNSFTKLDTHAPRPSFTIRSFTYALSYVTYPTRFFACRSSYTVKGSKIAQPYAKTLFQWRRRYSGTHNRATQLPAVTSHTHRATRFSCFHGIRHVSAYKKRRCLAPPTIPEDYRSRTNLPASFTRDIRIYFYKVHVVSPRTFPRVFLLYYRERILLLFHIELTIEIVFYYRSKIETTTKASNLFPGYRSKQKSIMKRNRQLVGL